MRPVLSIVSQPWPEGVLTTTGYVLGNEGTMVE
jgi:hypothetical protein